MAFDKQQKILKIAQFSIKNLSTGLVFGVGSEISAACAIYLQSLLFVELFTDRGVVMIAVLLCFMLLNHLLSPILAFFCSRSQIKAGGIFKSNLRNAFMQEITRLGPLRLEQMRIGRIQAMMTDGVESLEPYFIKYLSQIMITTISTLVLFIAIAMIDSTIALILLVFGISVVAIPRIWDKALGEKGHAHWSAYAAMNEDFIDNMAGMTTLKAFGAGKRRKNQLNCAGKHLLDTTLAQLRLGLSEVGLSSAASAIGPVIALAISAKGFQNDTIELWELFVIVLLARRFFNPFTTLSGLWHESFFGLSAMADIVAFFDNSKATTNKKSVTQSSGDIVFHDVNYSYPNAKSTALNDINISIPKGKMVAITGHSGSGKSTWLSLLMGFDQPCEGGILIGGIPANEINLAESICLVPQNTIIFQGTVRDILQSANPNVDEQFMLKSLKIACAIDLGQVEDHPLDLFIEPKGTNISGGQRQRLAIARALIRNTSILLLDEATSALDSHTERKILDAIQCNRPELTLIMVTHRSEVAQKADIKITFNNGQLEDLCKP